NYTSQASYDIALTLPSCWWTQPCLSSENCRAQERLLIMGPISRREFVWLGAGTVAAGAAAKTILLEPAVLAAPSDRKVRFVSIGTGIRGCDLLRSAGKLPNAECVGISDLYDMHRKASIEAWGSQIPTTRDYRELIARKHVEAVIVAVDHFQHRNV